MNRGLIAMIAVPLAALLLFYISPFWPPGLWDGGGLFGISWLDPRGGQLAGWLRGTILGDSVQLVWVACVFIVLSLFSHYLDS